MWLFLSLTIVACEGSVGEDPSREHRLREQEGDEQQAVEFLARHGRYELGKPAHGAHLRHHQLASEIVHRLPQSFIFQLQLRHMRLCFARRTSCPRQSSRDMYCSTHSGRDLCTVCPSSCCSPHLLRLVPEKFFRACGSRVAVPRRVLRRTGLCPQAWALPQRTQQGVVARNSLSAALHLCLLLRDCGESVVSTLGV